jgi:transcription termination factor Rho
MAKSESSKSRKRGPARGNGDDTAVPTQSAPSTASESAPAESKSTEPEGAPAAAVPGEAVGGVAAAGSSEVASGDAKAQGPAPAAAPAPKPPAAARGQSDEQLEAETQERYEQAKRSDLTIRELQKMGPDELHELARREGLDNFQNLKKRDLIFRVLQKHIAKQGLMYGEGVLEILPDGFGFLRNPEVSYLAGPDDIYVSPSQIRRFGLKVGHIVQGTIRPPKESERPAPRGRGQRSSARCSQRHQ